MSDIATAPTGSTTAGPGPVSTADTALVRRRIRRWLWLFIVCLALSGLTAFPLQTETALLVRAMNRSGLGDALPALDAWVSRVGDGVADGYGRHPFLAYGTDWLAFAHLVIAVAFWGPLRDPVRNVWVIRWAMIACGGVIPLALICGPLRGIPLFWQFVDMSFGVFGVVPLLIVHRLIRALEWDQAVRTHHDFARVVPSP
ncbi:hypothetical protein [Kitasatospora cheerisanensis]|uniref:Membrane protein n=1 Tax=Kitasatospora cheerisanensis KCTC 2395 TaxID=1348663 RepID=A0A066Z865_9ACTN|nr:hypothetical protein [Kitasatospora cheerisanensis]KDN86521.1 membrane protein [Kitasatospora cheerisanensis KCTC 2395]